MVRLGTGDLSAVLSGASPCGRTNTRIKGWMGRADQRTKVKGMFVDPRQIAEVRSPAQGDREGAAGGVARRRPRRHAAATSSRLELRRSTCKAIEATLRDVTGLGGDRGRGGGGQPAQ